ncbi:serine/threonine protein kinase [Candidatus Margulisiibacteriota bacterium]
MSKGYHVSSNSGQVQRLQLKQEIARSRRGRVYRERLGQKPIAVKVAHSYAYASFEEERPSLLFFGNEAKVLSRAQHPHIVKYIDHGNVHIPIDKLENDPRSFIAVEFVKGQNLRQTVFEEGQTLPENVALGVVYQIANAIGHIQAMGLVHGDVKIDNILFDPKRNHSVLIDPACASPPGDLFSHHFEGYPYSMLGTREYFSLDRARLQRYMPQYYDDVYALGICFYEILTGRLIFREGYRHDGDFNIEGRQAIGLNISALKHQGISEPVVQLMLKMTGAKSLGGFAKRPSLVNAAQMVEYIRQNPQLSNLLAHSS